MHRDSTCTCPLLHSPHIHLRCQGVSGLGQDNKAILHLDSEVEHGRQGYTAVGLKWGEGGWRDFSYIQVEERETWMNDLGGGLTGISTTNIQVCIHS